MEGQIQMMEAEEGEEGLHYITALMSMLEGYLRMVEKQEG